jgi:PAS domain-containing protein
MKKMTNKSEATGLRQAAEEKLKKKASKTSAKLSESDMLKLLHELEVHQIELEMQNEELMRAKEEARQTHDKYTSLYDFANNGYFTIDRNCKIYKLNLRGAFMLGRDRSTLVNKNFKQFVNIDSLHQFDDFIQKTFKTHSKETCQVKLITKGVESSFVRIEGRVSEDEDKCQIIVIDETMYMRTEKLLKFKAHELEEFDELMEVQNKQMIEFKKEINFLLKKLGEKEKFNLEE